MDAVLIYNGFPVKLLTKHGAILSSFKFSNLGTVREFKKGSVEFEFYDRSNFDIEDQKYTKYCKQGYYIKEKFADYKQNKVDLQVLNNYYFDENDFLRADIGDIIEVKRLNPYPFNQYYNNIKYTFKLSSISPIYFKNINDFPIVNSDVNSEFYSIVENYHEELETKYTGLFYLKNLGDEINNWDSQLFPDENSVDNQIVENLALEGVISKKSYAKLMVFICWKINEVYNEVLSKIAITDLGLIQFIFKEFIVGNDTVSYTQLPECDKIVAEICHQWGVLKYNYPTEINDFSPVFDATNPQYSKYLSYYQSLVNFYETLRFKDENILFPQFIDGVQVTEQQDSDRRIQYLSEINESALALLPFSERIKLLEKYTTQSEIEEGDQRFVVRIISSFNNAQDVDSFLDYIAKIRNGISTNFEIIYHKLDDARLERYTYISWAVDYQTNKKFYIYLLYEMWKISKYNFEYVPLGATNVYEGTNLDGFFLDTSSDGGAKYMPKHDINGELFAGQETLMEFRTIPDNSAGSNYVYKSTEIKYEPLPEMYEELIFIDEVITTSITTINEYSQGPGVYTVKNSNRRLFGQYHLYQPIGIFGYQENLELSIPDTGSIPAFLFFYAEDFDQTRDLDAALNFGLEVLVDVALFFLFGGAGVINHLKYARHLSKLKYLKRTIDATSGLPVLELIGISTNEVLIVWRSTQYSLEVISVTAGILKALFDYQAQIEDDQAKADLFKNVSNVFMFMALGTGIGSGFARSKAIKIADDILDNTTPAILNSMDADVLAVLQKLRNRKLNSIVNFATDTLQNLTLENSNVIYNFFNNLPADNILKDLFYQDFKDLIKKSDFANFLNDTDILSRWQQMADLKIAERVNIDILSSFSKTNAIVRFYSNASLRNVLEKLTFEKRWRFLDKMGDISPTNYTKFTNDSELITKWYRFYDEGILRDDFLILNITKQLEFVDYFGNVNNYWFNRFKLQSYLFDKFNTATTNSRLLAQNNPELWIRINRYYSSPIGLGEQLSSSYLFNKYKTYLAESLVNTVEAKAQELFALYPNRSYRDKNFQLVSGMIDKETGEISELFTNFSINHFKGNNLYESYRLSLHPNIRSLVEELENVKSLYNVDNNLIIDNAGHYIGAHAEVRALDDLIRKRFGNDFIDESVFNNWLENSVLGYNRNIQVKINNTKVIMPRCCDCFYITDLLTFIK